MPPAYVKPYVKRGKNDAADAEAICEAVRRPTMRFVPVKSREQQAALYLHRARTRTWNGARGDLLHATLIAKLTVRQEALIASCPLRGSFA